MRDLKAALTQRQTALVVGGIAVVALLVAWMRSGAGAGAAAGETVAVERRNFSAAVVAIGAVKAQIGAEVRVGSRISGRVRRLRANIGDAVTRGQVLAELETEDLDALLAQRQAELNLAEAKLQSLERLSPEEIARAAADLARFEATARLAAGEWARQQTLLSQGVAAAAEADAARERHLVAQAQRDAAQRALELARAGSVEQRKQAEAEVARARASLRSARVDRSFATITAPISGVVASVATQEGETVAAGLNAPTFVTILDLDRLQVNAYVDEVDIGKVAVGRAALFSVDAYPSQEFEGKVTAVYPNATIQDNVVKYVVAVSIASDTARRLRPEMTASVRIRLEPRSVLAIPVRAVGRDSGRSQVFLPANGGLEKRAVRLGWRDGAWAEVLDGLREGERILLDPPVVPPGGAP
ncbi:MAG TPA: efflux RND transporter periplasmic adaptor subunit [Gemmatimonadaceae bacterium]|nr:efflux RND transporter periplasmic adaptor subunit [Gemmatimonadaceae bacterium]